MVATLSLSFDCFSILNRVSKICFQFFPIFSIFFVFVSVVETISLCLDCTPYLRRYRKQEYVLVQYAIRYVPVQQEELPPRNCHFESCILRNWIKKYLSFWEFLTLRAAHLMELDQGLSSIRTFVLTSAKIADGDTVKYIMPWTLLIAVLYMALARCLLSDISYQVLNCKQSPLNNRLTS